MVDDYHQWLLQTGVESTLNGIWSTQGTVNGQYGWKLHLSSTQHQAKELMLAVLPLLERTCTPFKIARDSQILQMLNEGSFSPTQIGKFMTIYPDSPERSLQLAKELVRATEGFTGPSIITDLHLGSVVYTRYGSFRPPIVRDRLGQVQPVPAHEDGEYRVPFAPPADVPNPFADFASNESALESDVRPIGPGYLLLRPLSVHGKGSVYLAMDVRQRDSARLVVLKEGRPHCLSDSFGRDIRTRLLHQAELHGSLAGVVNVPEAGEVFEHAGNLYLPVEYVPGRDLSEYDAIPFSEKTPESRRQVLEDFWGLSQVVEALHREGYVHRDLSPRNIRVSQDGLVFLLDLELCHLANDVETPVFAQGTPGFTSPQQVASSPPSIADDVFSLGALLIMALTGFDPQRVLFGMPGQRLAQLRSLSGAPESLCRAAAMCVDPDSEARPTVAQVAGVLRGLLDSPEESGAVERLSQHDLESTVTCALRSLTGSGFRDTVHNLWLSPEVEASRHDAHLLLQQGFAHYRSTSRGVAGVVYAISRLQRYGFEHPGAAFEVERAVDWLLDHHPTADDQLPGLHFGEAGVALAICEAINVGLLPRGSWLEPYVSEALQGPLDWPDVTHGAAGQGMAAFGCADLLCQPDLARYAEPCIGFLVESQNSDGSWTLPAGVKSMEGGIYTGFAHGVAGMLYFLARAAARLNSSPARKAADRGGAWLLGQARWSQERETAWWPMRTDTEESWMWWCHGGPGIALSLLALYDLTKDPSYAETARAALRIHPLCVRHANLSQCHGLSGLGEILLEAYAALNEPEWLDRAERIGVTLDALARKDARAATWLVENPYQPTSDLMIGCSGVAHFLARLTQPEIRKAEMPLLPC